MQIKSTMSYRYVSEQPKYTTLTNLNAGEDMEQQELSLLVAVPNVRATWEDICTVFYKTKHTLISSSSSYAPGYLTEGIGNVCPHKHLHTDVFNNFIHSFQNVEVTKMPLYRLMNK